MGIRGEIFSTRVLLENRTYFFNIKENRLGDIYLNIVESKNRETGGGFDRQSVILFAEDLPEFLGGFEEALRILEKADREKRRQAGARGPARAEAEESADREARPYRKKTGGNEGGPGNRGDEKPRGRRDERPRVYGEGKKRNREDEKPGRGKRTVRVRASRGN